MTITLLMVLNMACYPYALHSSLSESPKLNNNENLGRDNLRKCFLLSWTVGPESSIIEHDVETFECGRSLWEFDLKRFIRGVKINIATLKCTWPCCRATKKKLNIQAKSLFLRGILDTGRLSRFLILLLPQQDLCLYFHHLQDYQLLDTL